MSILVSANKYFLRTHSTHQVATSVSDIVDIRANVERTPFWDDCPPLIVRNQPVFVFWFGNHVMKTLEVCVLWLCNRMGVEIEFGARHRLWNELEEHLGRVVWFRFVMAAKLSYLFFTT